MFKLCSCFKGNNNDNKKTKKNLNVKLNEKKYIHFGLFLTGDDESGKTKLIEELSHSHDPFTRKDKILKTSQIEEYIRDSLTNILHAFKENDPPIQLEYPETEHFINYILTTAQKADYEYPLEFFKYVEILLADAGLQLFLDNCTTHQFPNSAKYFLDRISEIRDPDYIPTTEDMIQSRLFPSQIFQTSFEIKKERICFDLLEMNLFDEKQEELIKSFKNKRNIIFFIIDCSCFDKIINKKTYQTQLHQSINLYKTIQNNKWLKKIPCILLFNKQDILENKIKNGIKIEKYFPDFNDYVIDTHSIDSSEDPEVIRAKYFIESQFLKINSNNCYCQFTCDNDISIHLIYDDCSKIYQHITS